MLHGLKIAWDYGASHLILEANSQMAISFASEGCDAYHPFVVIVLKDLGAS